MIPNHPHAVCNTIDLVLKRQAEVRNFIPQGRTICSSLPGLILVHPFYYGSNLKKYLIPNQLESDGTYRENILGLLSDSKRNIFLFETSGSIFSTIDVLSKFRSLDGVYLIRTEEDSSVPISAGFDPWQNMAEKILKVSKEFEFAGGEVHGDLDDVSSLCGCLGGAFRHLSNCGVKGKFKEGACYYAKCDTELYF